MNMPASHSFDPRALLADVGGNEEVVGIVLAAYPGWQEEMSAQLDAARGSGDPAKLARVAHGLRGTLAQLHADEAAALASAIETACQEEGATIASVDARVDRMQALLATIAAEVAAFLAS